VKKSNEVDVVCINKILKYIENISDAYATFQISNADNLARNEICHLAITQIITNIYVIKLKMQDVTLDKTPLFNKIGLKAARNIASHDYDSLDFDIIYKCTCRLLNPEVFKELETVKNDIK
jgi:uncharacterized protein with HEPN domain